jgi:hypothetical protein
VRRRKPMPEIASTLTVTLAAVSEADAELRAAEEGLAQARGRFREALIAAHKAGASYTLLGNLVGLTRQRIGHIVAGD